MTTVGILGTGIVGRTLAARLAELGADVVVGARTADSQSLEQLAELNVGTGSFADAAGHGDLIINATNGLHSLAVLESVGSDALVGKTLVDVANELQPVEGGLPKPVVAADASLAQRIQDAYPDTFVVKSLNTMGCHVMVNPSIVAGDHTVFLSGDDAGAKQRVQELLASFGWRPEQMLDLGGIDTAAGPELMMTAWIRVMIARGFDGTFNWAVNSA